MVGSRENFYGEQFGCKCRNSLKTHHLVSLTSVVVRMQSHYSIQIRGNYLDKYLYPGCT